MLSEQATPPSLGLSSDIHSPREHTVQTVLPHHLFHLLTLNYFWLWSQELSRGLNLLFQRCYPVPGHYPSCTLHVASQSAISAQHQSFTEGLHCLPHNWLLDSAVFLKGQVMLPSCSGTEPCLSRRWSFNKTMPSSFFVKCAVPAALLNVFQ